MGCVFLAHVLIFFSRVLIATHGLAKAKYTREPGKHCPVTSNLRTPAWRLACDMLLLYTSLCVALPQCLILAGGWDGQSLQASSIFPSKSMNSSSHVWIPPGTTFSPASSGFSRNQGGHQQGKSEAHDHPQPHTLPSKEEKSNPRPGPGVHLQGTFVISALPEKPGVPPDVGDCGRHGG